MKFSCSEKSSWTKSTYIFLVLSSVFKVTTVCVDDERMWTAASTRDIVFWRNIWVTLTWNIIMKDRGLVGSIGWTT
ncbi:hypothetical protein CPB86DRAFT_532267 [Serendipita vermifera]|nr:hypothetical protein CPB86DRAFT_532267 [Serendipita vermifera]